MATGVVVGKPWASLVRCGAVDEPAERPEVTNAELYAVLRSIDNRMAKIGKSVADIRTVVMLVGTLTVIGVVVAVLAGGS